MEPRKLKQYGWISGPVECCCTACDWSTSFIAVDSSIPIDIYAEFAAHDCEDHALPIPINRYQA
jgi:hypothetical protein